MSVPHSAYVACRGRQVIALVLLMVGVVLAQARHVHIRTASWSAY